MRYYCQFHFGGFRTYQIDGQEHEFLEKVISSESRYDMPLDTEADMNNNSLKLVYRQTNDGILSLTIRCIPSIKTDTSGTPIHSALMIVGGIEEKERFESVLRYYMCNRDDFDTFFRDLFSLRGGLQIEGEKLKNYINEITSVDLQSNEDVESLRNIVSPFTCTLALNSSQLHIEKNQASGLCEYGSNSNLLKEGKGQSLVIVGIVLLVIFACSCVIMCGQ